MINKDYILRLAERIGRAMAIILGLREADQLEDALIYIDELMLQTTGLTSRFINSLSDEMLAQALSPLGTLNIDKCLWVASLLKAEGDIYKAKDNDTESYYRYLRSLNLFLEVQLHDRSLAQNEFFADIDDLLQSLAEYELPAHTKRKLISYYELSGRYAKAEDMLFELLEPDPTNPILHQEGLDFYHRLLAKSNYDLQAGNLTREEVEEGLRRLEGLLGM
jgi:tetratricopeptide (TPR) repeat protein